MSLKNGWFNTSHLSRRTNRIVGWQISKRNFWVNVPNDILFYMLACKIIDSQLSFYQTKMYTNDLLYQDWSFPNFLHCVHFKNIIFCMTIRFVGQVKNITEDVYKKKYFNEKIS